MTGGYLESPVTWRGVVGACTREDDGANEAGPVAQRSRSSRGGIVGAFAFDDEEADGHYARTPFPPSSTGDVVGAVTLEAIRAFESEWFGTGHPLCQNPYNVH